MEKAQLKRVASQLCHHSFPNHDIKNEPDDDPLSRLDHAIDVHSVPWGVNESVIESILDQWEGQEKKDQPRYWLAAARILEMAILCAGHYVDNCEFTAAGDLLFNPRKILIYQNGCRTPIEKYRRGRISDQLHGRQDTDQLFPFWFREHAAVRVIKPAVIPFILQRLERSGYMKNDYLHTIHQRMKKAADTIAFLNAWSISSYENFKDRLASASDETRRFIANHLCAFDNQAFNALGKEIHDISKGVAIKSRFIVPSATTTGSEPCDQEKHFNCTGFKK